MRLALPNCSTFKQVSTRLESVPRDADLTVASQPKDRNLRTGAAVLPCVGGTGPTARLEVSMLLSLALVAAVTTTVPRPPELIAPEPTTTNARLLDAFQRAEDDFKSVQRELGLVGAAPLAGIQEQQPAARRVAKRPAKPGGVQKAALRVDR